MFNFLSNYNVTPYFSDGELGKKFLSCIHVHTMFSSAGREWFNNI